MKTDMQIMRQLTLCTTITATAMFFLSVILYSHAATAATYYVATNGQDANPGTQMRPFRTISKGLSILTAGDILYIRGGTYNERIDSNNQTIPTGTSWSNVVTIAAFPGETVSLQPSSRGSGEVVNLAHSYIQYVVFDGLILDAINCKYGFVVGNGGNHIRFQNGEVKNAGGPDAPLGDGGNAIVVGDGSNFNEFINLNVHDTHPLPPGDMHGFYIRGSNNVIDGCDVHDNGGFGIQIYSSKGGVNNNIVRNNKVYRNGIVAKTIGGGITLNSGDGNTAYNNVVWNNYQEGITNYWGGATNTKIYNNTVYQTSGIGIGVNSGIRGTIIQNNIAYPKGITNYGATSPTISHNLTTNPSFMKADNADFHLQAVSAARDAGITISIVTKDRDGATRPQGVAYDIGAYEHLDSQLSPPTGLRIVSP